MRTERNRIQGIVTRLGAVALFAALCLPAIDVSYAMDTDITVGVPRKPGYVSLDLIENYGDSSSKRCSITVPIAMGTAAAKATAIFDALFASCPDIIVVQSGATISLLTTPNPVYINSISDTTSQVASIFYPGIGTVIPYYIRAKLKGTPSGGGLLFGEDGINHGVPTDDPIPDILEDLRDAFGEGEINRGGFDLPDRLNAGPIRFEYDVIDTGLDIDVEARNEDACTTIPSGGGRTIDSRYDAIGRAGSVPSPTEVCTDRDTFEYDEPGTVNVGRPRKITPEGQIFPVPFQIRIQIDPDDLPQGSTINDVFILKRNDQTNEVTTVFPNVVTQDYVAIDVTSFSSFQPAVAGFAIPALPRAAGALLLLSLLGAGLALLRWRPGSAAAGGPR